MRGKVILLCGAGLFTLISASVLADETVRYVQPEERRGLTNFKEKPRTVPFSETVFGVKLNDPYRWMEDDANAEEVRAWLKAAGAHTARQLAALPGRKRLLATLKVALKDTAAISQVIKAGNRLFFLRAAPGENLPKLYVRKGKSERVLIDPADFADDSEAPPKINSYGVSPGGKRVAFHIASGGREIGTIHFLDVRSGKVLEQHKIENVWGGYQPLWIDDDSIVSTQMTFAIKNDPQQGAQAILYRLRDGQKVALFGYHVEGAPEIEPQDDIRLHVTPGSSWLIGQASQPGAGLRLFVRRHDLALSESWVELAGPDDQIRHYALAGDRLYLQSTKDAPNAKIVMLDLSRSTNLTDAQVILPESEAVLSALEATPDGAYIVGMVDGMDKLTFVPAHGGKPQNVPLPFNGVIGGLRPSAERTGFSFAMSGLLQNVRYFDVSGMTIRALGLQADSYPNANAFEVVSEHAISADKTEVPMTILRRRGAPLSGQAPALIFAYGGYGVSLRPTYSPNAFPWLEEGGIYAICHVRGGGEKGQFWHEAGKGKNKPKGHADLIACAEHLIERGYTRPGRLMAGGVSMGGVLIGPAVLKRPDLFKVGALAVAILNPTRILAAQNGLNQISEIGDPRTQEGFAALREMDAYEWLSRAKAYPDFILSVGLNDQRVEPWFSAKFAARLRSLSEKTLVMIRTDEDAGHGPGATRDQFASIVADNAAFALNRFGHPDFQGPK